LKTCQAQFSLANSFYSSFPDECERDSNRTPNYQLKALRAYALGCYSGRGGSFSSRLFLGLFFLYPRAPLWVMLILGFIYSLMVNANINGVGHNFIHNPFFAQNC